MVNSTSSIFIKPIIAFNCGDTFVLGLGCAPLTVPDPSNAASP
jgi:hypothetical protein